jgi:hypothetical protein
MPRQEKLNACLEADGQKESEIEQLMSRIKAMQVQLDDARAVR